MRVLDLDMDYFMKSVATFINESEPERLPEEDYGDSVWSEREVRNFLEGNLGLSKQNRIRGRVVAGHNESLFFWRELIEKGDLSTPFDVIHVDSHADLGLGYETLENAVIVFFVPRADPVIDAGHKSVDIRRHGRCGKGIVAEADKGMDQKRSFQAEQHRGEQLQR